MKLRWVTTVGETLGILVILAALTFPLLAIGALVIPDGCLGRFARSALASLANPQGVRAALAYCRRSPRGMS